MKRQHFILLFILHDLQKTLGRCGAQHTGGLGHEEGTWGSNKSTESWAGAGGHPHSQALPPLTPHLKGFMTG